MRVEELNAGDTVFAAIDIINDGSHPELDENTTIATRGTRGVLVNIGHIEENPDKKLMLVRFESTNLDLGPPVGCWIEELSCELPKDS
jgi:nitrogen fixation protein NifZ